MYYSFTRILHITSLSNWLPPNTGCENVKISRLCKSSAGMFIFFSCIMRKKHSCYSLSGFLVRGSQETTGYSSKQADSMSQLGNTGQSSSLFVRGSHVVFCMVKGSTKVRSLSQSQLERYPKNFILFIFLFFLSVCFPIEIPLAISFVRHLWRQKAETVKVQRAVWLKRHPVSLYPFWCKLQTINNEFKIKCIF